MDGTFKLLVKKGDYGYQGDRYGVMDYVAEFETLSEALKDFLEWSEDTDQKVTLTFKPKKVKK